MASSFTSFSPKGFDGKMRSFSATGPTCSTGIDEKLTDDDTLLVWRSYPLQIELKVFLTPNVMSLAHH
jgi:hypothetical protein